MTLLSTSAQQVQDALDKYGLTLKVVELPSSTRTAADAAKAIGCEIGQIAKSLIFMARDSQHPVLVIASGVNRVNESSIGAILDEKIGKADADFVRQQTGFAIGGVPPVGHIRSMEIFIDEDLFTYEVIWAAAGTPHAVFRLTPHELERISGGRVISVL